MAKFRAVSELILLKTSFFVNWVTFEPDQFLHARYVVAQLFVLL